MNEKQLVERHLCAFINKLATALREFVEPLDPTVGKEEMEYIRAVMKAVDDVALVASMATDDEEVKATVYASSDEMMRRLIKMHVKSEVVH